MTKLTFVQLDPEDSERRAAVVDLLVQLEPHIDSGAFEAVYRAAFVQGLRYTVLYSGQLCVAVAGWRIIDCVHTVREMRVEDFVTDAEFRSQGLGRALFGELERLGIANECRRLTLDSNINNHRAHLFYEREGMQISSHHFVKTLS